MQDKLIPLIQMDNVKKNFKRFSQLYLENEKLEFYENKLCKKLREFAHPSCFFLCGPGVNEVLDHLH